MSIQTGSAGARERDPAALVGAVLAGVPDALDAWFRGEHPPVYRLCYGLLAQAAEAEDAAQDALLHLFDRLERWDRARPYASWRNAVVVNLCRDRLRRRTARARAEQADAERALDQGSDPLGAAGRARGARARHGRRRRFRTPRAALGERPSRPVDPGSRAGALSMMRNTMQTFVRASLCAALVPLTSLAQEPESAPAPLSVSAQELVLAYYRPLHYEAVEMAGVAGDLFGRHFWVREHGGLGQSNPVQNIRLLGDQVLVYDLRANTERILAGLREVDARAGERAEQAEVLQEAEVRPRFVRLDTIDELLRASRRKILWEGQQAQNYVLLEERGIVLLRDTPERLASLLAAVAAIDVPPPQVRVRFQLLQLVPEGAGGEELPEPLARALAELLPGNRFRRAGTAVLETAVLSNTVLKARLGSYDAEIVPNAYDQETGTLSTRSCSLYSRGEGGVEQMFQTSVVLHGGELTVLGATGTFTVFLVVEVEPRR